MNTNVLEFASLTVRGSRLAASPIGECGFNVVRGEHLTMRGSACAGREGACLDRRLAEPRCELLLPHGEVLATQSRLTRMLRLGAASLEPRTVGEANSDDRSLYLVPRLIVPVAALPLLASSLVPVVPEPVLGLAFGETRGALLASFFHRASLARSSLRKGMLAYWSGCTLSQSTPAGCR